MEARALQDSSGRWRITEQGEKLSIALEGLNGRSSHALIRQREKNRERMTGGVFKPKYHFALAGLGHRPPSVTRELEPRVSLGADWQGVGKLKEHHWSLKHGVLNRGRRFGSDRCRKAAAKSHGDANL